MELLEFTDYAKNETERVKNVLPKREKSDLRFAFITDLHYKFVDEMRTTVSNIVHAVNELNKSAKIDFLCLGGDNVGNYPTSPEEHVEMMKELAALLENCDVPVFCVQGNHDDNSIHGRIEGTNKCLTGFEVPDEMQYDIFFAPSEKHENFHSGVNKALYGYFDIPTASTRVVFLDSSDMPYFIDDGVIRYNQQWNFGYTGKQLSWLCGEALADAPENVFFIEHMPFDHVRHFSEEEPCYNADALDTIISCFADGKKVHVASTEPDFEFELSADFKGQPHNVPARIAGHCHVDTQSVDKAGFLSITSMLAGRKNSGMGVGDNGVTYEREPYSASETSMDIFTFSPKKYTLEATRYGLGESRTFNLKKRS